MKARDIMTSPVETVSLDTSMQDIIAKMSAMKVGSFPVVDENNKIAGIVSEHDILGLDNPEAMERRERWLAKFAEGEMLNPEFILSVKNSLNKKAREVMTTSIVTVEEDASVAHIAKIFFERKLRHAPVIKNGQVVGIVSRADLIQAMINS